MKRLSNLFFLFFAIAIAILLNVSSCKLDTNKNSNSFFPTQSSDTLKLEVGFPSLARTFTYEGKVYNYFYDLVTMKKVKLYDENFKWIKTFSLDQFSELGLFMVDMEMITPDSVLILTNYETNTLISYNIKTQKEKYIDLNQLIPIPELGPSLEFYSSAYSGFRFKDGVTLEAKASQAALVAMYPDMDSYQMIKLYDSINKTLPYNLYIEHPFSKNPKVNFIQHSENFKETFGDAYFNTLSFNFLGPDKLVNTTAYMDYFDVYDVIKNKNVKKSIRSKYTDLAVPTRKWNDLDKDPSLVLDNNTSNDDYRAAGKANRIFYDSKNKRYHVFLFYSKNKRPKIEPKVSPFIWQVYDENFNLLDEREHNPTDLVCGSSFVSGDRLYVQYYNEKTIDHSNPVYIRFNF